MAIDSGLKKADGVDLGNNLFAGNGTSNGNQVFNILMKNGVDLGKGWYNKTACSAAYGNIGFKNAAGVDVGTLLGKYGTVNCNCNCTCDTDRCTCDTDRCQCDSDSDGGCFVYGKLLTNKGLLEPHELKIGMKIWGADERFHTILGIAKSTVGSRGVYVMPHGGGVTADHIIYSGDVAYTADKSAAVTTGLAVLKDDEYKVEGRYNVPEEVLEIDGAKVVHVSADIPTYSPICQDAFIGYLNGERVAVAGRV